MAYSFEDFAQFEADGRSPDGAGRRSYARSDWDGALPDSVKELAASDSQIDRLLNIEAVSLTHVSESEADMSLAVRLACAGVPGHDIDAALRFRRSRVGGKRKRDHYFTLTVEKALAWDARDRDGHEELDEEGRPTIVVNPRQLRELISEALGALDLANQPPRLFERSGRLVRVRIDESSRARIEHLSVDAMVAELTDAADFLRATKNRRVAISPPRHLASALLELREFPFPSVRGLTESPVIRPDGSVLEKPGYDVKTGLIYTPDPRLRIGSIPAAPTPNQMAASASVVEDALADFPFSGDSDRATQWALLLTLVLRELIGGQVPMFLVDSPQAGTGKTLLADLTAVVSTGRPASVMAPPEANGDDEWRKRVTSTLIGGAAFVVIDNVTRPLRSPSLSAVITARSWEDRILGRSENATISSRAVWMATGNNIQVGGDLPRRCVRCRLDAKVARPYQRAQFRHQDLMAWALRNRGALLAALLTIGRAWTVAGRPGPSSTTPQMGSFEQWRSTVGGVLHFMRIPGFLEDQSLNLDEADSEAGQWGAFLREWYALFRSTPKAVSELWRTVSGDPHAESLREVIPDYLAGDMGDRSRFVRRLGRALSSRVDARFQDDHETFHIERTRSVARTKRSATWRVVKS